MDPCSWMVSVAFTARFLPALMVEPWFFVSSVLLVVTLRCMRSSLFSLETEASAEAPAEAFTPA